jgi:hypothetical protein
MLDTINDFNFPVELQAVYDQHGEPIPNASCVMRRDINLVLGVHGGRYKIVTHDDVVNSIIDGVREANLPSDYELKVHVIEDGRKMRGEILFNDLTIQPKVGDYVKFRVSFFNSYDASWSFSQSADGLRLFCLNGCTRPDNVASTRYKHTQSISVQGSAAKMIKGLETFMDEPNVWREWMRLGVSRNFVENFFKQTVAKAPSQQRLEDKTNNKQLEKLLGIYDNEVAALGSNKWALYNCLTYWASHTDDTRNPQVTRRNREEAIASAMRHKLWQEIDMEGIF